MSKVNVDSTSLSYTIFLLGIVFDMSGKSVPTFDKLPVDKDGPFLNAWGL